MLGQRVSALGKAESRLLICFCMNRIAGRGATLIAMLISRESGPT